MGHFVLWFVKLTGVLPFLLLFRPRKYYAHKSSRGGNGRGEILMANHTTLMDFAMMIYIYPFRTIRVLMAEVLYKTGLLAWFMHQLHGIRVNRYVPQDTDRLWEAIETLKEGGTVGIFPEGRLNREGRDYGSLLRFHHGAAYLSLKTGAPVRPVYFHTIFGFRRSGIMIGDPVNLREKFGESTDPDNLAAATRYLEAEMNRLRDMLKFRSGHRRESLLTGFTFWSAYIGMKIAFNCRICGEKEVLRSRPEKGCIIASNHTGVFDPPLLSMVFHKIRPHIMAAESLYDYPMLGVLLRRLGCIRIDRHAIDMEAFHLILSVLQVHESVGIFPEGQLEADGGVGPFHPGTALAALTSGADIIPVYIAGRPRAFHPGSYSVWIGKPLRMEGDMTPDNIRIQTERLRTAVLELQKSSQGVK